MSSNLATTRAERDAAEAALERVRAVLDEHPGSASDSAIKLVARIWRAINDKAEPGCQWEQTCAKRGREHYQLLGIGMVCACRRTWPCSLASLDGEPTA